MNITGVAPKLLSFITVEVEGQEPITVQVTGLTLNDDGTLRCELTLIDGRSAAITMPTADDE